MVSSEVLKKDKKYKPKIKNYQLDAKTGNVTNSSDEDAAFLDKASDLNSEPTENEPYKLRLVKKNILAFTLMHYYTVVGMNYFLRLDSYKVLYIQFLYSLVTNMGVTAGAHRLWSHRTYKAKRPLEYVLAFLFVCSGQNDIYEWCRDHRAHHKWSETDADPHNAKRGFFFAHMGWLCCKKHPEVIRKGKTLDMSDLEHDPMVIFQRKYYKLLHPLLVLLLPAYIVMYYTGLSFYWAFISSVARYQIVLHFTWLVNSAAHLWGDRPYNEMISPTESKIAIFGTFAFGEGYHNYHHTYPWDYKCSEYGFHQWNLTALMIEIFAYFGWAYDLKTANSQLVNKMKEGVIKRKQSNQLDPDDVEEIINQARAY